MERFKTVFLSLSPSSAGSDAAFGKRREFPANFSLQLSTQAAAAQLLWKAGQH